MEPQQFIQLLIEKQHEIEHARRRILPIHLAVDDVLSAQQRLITFKRREKLYTFSIVPFILLWLACIPFGVFHGTDIPYPSSDRLLFYIVAIVIVFALSSCRFQCGVRCKWQCSIRCRYRCRFWWRNPLIMRVQCRSAG
jgi:hypothetical protein